MIKRDQKGMAAIVVSVVLIALLSAVAVSFAVIMNREMQKAVNNQLGQAAYDAAASGINDAISYVRDNPTTNISNCADLVGPGKPLSAAANLSGDGSTKYTCVLINTLPLDLAYQNIPANQSQVVLVTGSSKMSKLMFSWQSSSRTHNQFIPSFPPDQLFDETTWSSSKYEPLLQVSLYPVPLDTKDVSFANGNSKTFFLYPTKAAGFAVNNLSYATANGTLQQVECGLTNTNGQFNGTADYACNLIIDNLPSANPVGYQYYVRIMPMYQAADVKIRANDSTAALNPVGFMNSQAIIDVTAQSASAVKRLQARVDISGLNAPSQNITPADNNLPEFAIRQPITICKRLINAGSNFPAYIDSSALAYCGSDVGILKQLEPPVVSASCSASDQNNASCSGTVDPNNGTVSSCSWSLNSGQSSPCPGTATHSRTPYSVSWSIGGLTAGTTYTATLCATNQAGQRCTSTSFDTPAPPPPAGQTVFVQLGWSVTITGYGPGLNNCDFYNGGTSSAPGSWLASWYPNPPDASYADTHSYGSSNYSPPAGTRLINCKGISGASGWSDTVPAPPASLTINYFVVQGPYYNPNISQRFCPDDVHHYQVCMNWAVTTSYNGGIQCKASWKGPTGGVSNSGWITTISIGSSSGGGGSTFGSDDSTFLYIPPSSNGSGSLQCQGIGGGGPSASVSEGNPPAQTKAGNYWYNTINCLNSASHQQGGFCVAN